MAKLSVVVPANEVEVNGQKYRKVERKAQAGDIVKALTDSYIDVIKGAFYEITTRCGQDGFYDDNEDFRIIALRNPKDFEIYEKVTPEYREVKRKADAGERIRIVDRWSSVDPYENGAELVVKSRLDNVRIASEFNGRNVVINDAEYVVLEPVIFTKPQYREVQREAKVGERIRIVNAGFAGNPPTYKNGEEFTVVEIKSNTGVRIDRKWLDNSDINAWVAHREYIVLEPVNAEPAPQIKRRLTVGDYARVIESEDGDHNYELGSVVKIVEDAHDYQPYKAERADGTIGNWLFEEDVQPATEAEFSAQKPNPERLKVGELARTLVGKDVPKGAIVRITRDDRSALPYRGELLDGSEYDWYAPGQLEKVSEEEAKWAAIGRKVGEYKAGDVVKCIGLAAEEAGLGEVIGRGWGDRVDVRYFSRHGRCAETADIITLVTPVEQRFDLAEGGADLSK